MVGATVRRHGALFAGIFFLLAGFGLVGSLVSLVLASRGQADWVGWLGAAYYVGLGVGSIRGERVIASVGYLRAYGLLTSAACLAMLVLVLVDHPVAWMVGRGLQGVALGGLFVCIESWLGSSARRETRGQVLAVYQVVVFLGLLVGQALLGGLASSPQTGFVLCAAFVCMASLPVGATTMDAPVLVVQPRLRLGALWSVASLGMLGVVVSGITTGSIYAVAPAAGAVAGLSDGEVAWLMSAFVGGGMLLQLVVGRVSDTYDRRVVLAGVSTLGALGALGSMALTGRPTALIAVSVLEGGFLFALYGIALAYTLDRVEPARAVSANAALLALFCAGSAGGSTLSAWALGAGGPAGFFAIIGGSALILAVAAIRAAWMWDPLPEEARHDVVAVPNTSAVLVELDPRVEMGAFEGETDGIPTPVRDA